MMTMPLDGVGAEYPEARTEEPMDVGAMSEISENSSLRKKVDNMKQQVTGMMKLRSTDENTNYWGPNPTASLLCTTSKMTPYRNDSERNVRR